MSSNQDGGLWGLGRWSRANSDATSSYVEDYTPPAVPQYYPGSPSYYPDTTAYAANSSTPSAPPAEASYPDYNSEFYPPYGAPTPSRPYERTSSFLYPRIHESPPAHYPPVAWQGSPYVTSPPAAQDHSDPSNSYSPYVSPYASYAAPPQAPPGASGGYGGFPAPYNQVADPTAVAYNLPPSPAALYPSSPAGYGSGSYDASPEPYPPPVAPPSLESLSLDGHGRDGRFRANSMPGNCFSLLSSHVGWEFPQFFIQFTASETCF